MNLLELCFVAVIVALLGVLIWAAVAEGSSPTFELNKADWVCTASHQEMRLRPQWVGKTMIQIPYSAEVCDRWERRP